MKGIINQEKFYLGIDGGGTKSSITISFDNDIDMISFNSGPLNICSVPTDVIYSNLKNILDQIKNKSLDLSKCAGIGIGVAGFSNPQANLFFTRAMANLFPGVPISVRSDATIALYGAHMNYEGIILISGTGSVCYGSSGGVTWQAGGGGHIIDDAGSGYSIGRDILASVIQANDERISPTVFKKMLISEYGLCTTGDIIEFVYDSKTSKENIAAIAPLLTLAYDTGDPTAIRIVNKTSEDLMGLLCTVVKKLEMPFGPLAFEGSIIKKDQYIYDSLCKNISKKYPGMIVYKAKNNASYGAVLLAEKAALEVIHERGK